MRAIDRALLLAAVVALAGCPRFTNDGLACGANGACPSGFHCAADHRCWKMNQNPDLSAVVTTEHPDLAGVDLYGVVSPDLYGVAPGADLATPATAGPDMAASRGIGQLCGGKSDCMSGNCVDGVCCDMPCTSPCLSCNQPTSLGKCTAVAPGSTPSHGTCGPDPMTSCGLTGKCDGAGNCSHWDSSTVCGASTCTGTTFTAAKTCDGAGHCVAPMSTDCGFYNCDSANGVCFSSCTAPDTAMHCSATSPGCSSNSCGKRANGQPCPNGATDCTSGNCVDGVCCSSTQAQCNGCKTCNGTNPGTCTNVVSGDPHNVCPTNVSLCQAGGCSGGVCIGSTAGTICNSSCTSTNMFAVAKCTGTAGSCPALGAPAACPADLTCADGASCRQSCSADSDCISGDWCNGSNCQQQIAVGQSGCSPTTLCNGTTCDQCSSGGCNPFYLDQDHDTYGITNIVTYYCAATTSPPSGYAARGGDCCDTDSLANPGQTGWYATTDACGNYDYNCVNGEETEFKTVNTCDVGCGNGGCSASTKAGWSSSIPGCAGSALWTTCKNSTCADGTVCVGATPTSHTQYCH